MGLLTSVGVSGHVLCMTTQAGTRQLLAGITKLFAILTAVTLAALIFAYSTGADTSSVELLLLALVGATVLAKIASQPGAPA